MSEFYSEGYEPWSSTEENFCQQLEFWALHLVSQSITYLYRQLVGLHYFCLSVSVCPSIHPSIYLPIYLIIYLWLYSPRGPWPLFSVS
jgi:hypothetical protein